MKRRNQKVTLENKKTKETREIRVILADSRQGYLGSIPTGKPDYFIWQWYHPDLWKQL